MGCLILTFGSVCICVFFRWLSRGLEGDAVSCLVWILSDNHLQSFCYMSHCCNVMGCEPQGQFVGTHLCV